MTRDLERIAERQAELQQRYPKFGEIYEGPGAVGVNSSDDTVIARVRDLAKRGRAFTPEDVRVLLDIMESIESSRDRYRGERNAARKSLNESIQCYNAMVGNAAKVHGYAVAHSDVMQPGVFGTKEQAEFHRSTTLGSAGVVCQLTEVQ